jgi:hypothetical protein
MFEKESGMTVEATGSLSETKALAVKRSQQNKPMEK